MKFFKHAFLLLCSFLFINASVLIILSQQFEPFIHSDVYKHALEEGNVYDFIYEEVNQGPFPLFSKESIRRIVRQVLDKIFSYINSETDELDLEIEVNTTKIDEFFTQQIEELPICAPLQFPITNDEVECRPAQIQPEEFVDIVLEQQQIELEDFKTVDLMEVVGDTTQFDKARENISFIKQLLNISFIVALLSFATIIFLTRKNLASLFRWIGFNFASIGINLVSVFFAFDKIVFPMILSQNIPIDIQFVRDIVSPIIQPILFLGSLLLGIGVILFVISFIIRHK